MKHKSELHARWHRRVEGQIRDCMMKHPKWFAGVPKSERKQFIESIAKRVVGEILADGPETVGRSDAGVAVNHGPSRGPAPAQ